MFIPAHIGKVLILILKRVQAFKARVLVHVTVKYLSWIHGMYVAIPIGKLKTYNVKNNSRTPSYKIFMHTA